MELVSVIIPAYNVESYIERCLESVLKQTYNNLEIIVVDDGSIDSTYEKCKQIANTDNRIRLYRQENGGVSYARNRGLEYSKGDYVCFVDADDYVLPLYVEIMINNIRITDADLAITMCKRNKINTLNKEYVQVEVWDNKEALVNLMKRNIYANGVVGKLFRTDLIKDLCFEQNLKIGEDKLFVYRSIDICKKIVFQDVDLYCYCTRMGSAMNSSFDSRYLDVKKVNTILYEMWTRRFPDLTPLFKKEVVMSYVRCVQDSFFKNSDESLKLRKLFVEEIKKCRISEVKNFCNMKELCLILLVQKSLWILKIYEKLKRFKGHIISL